MCAAFLAAADLLADVRLAALLRACVDSARFDAAACPSFFKAVFVARDRAADFFAAAPADRLAPAFVSDAAFFFVAAEADLPAPTATPALRALDNPMAMACFAERAPCFPSRT
ncbi:hypothetical protein FHW69_003125 [Luteibacter sp. Sphag1AF]|nr:hypothetical protein [Luteibacter sp. Sphag1AF]